ncbi:MAG: S-layer homology domain-containing protein [Parabacteroides sp.]|nr:S-layer homology domain-containing protein [Parabacteroides sp.]
MKNKLISNEKIFYILLIFTILICSVFVNPIEVSAKTLSSDPAETLEVWIRYSDYDSNDYRILKTFDYDYFKKNGSTETYTFIDSLPVPCASPAKGVYLEELLSECGINAEDMTQIRVWCTDGNGKSPNKTYSYKYLFGKDRYFYPNMKISDNWEAGSSSTKVKFHDMELAASGKQGVEPMLAYADNWQRYMGAPEDGGEINDIDLTYNNLDDCTRYRLLFGLEDLSKYSDGDEINANAFDSLKWIYRMDVVVNYKDPNPAPVPIDGGGTKKDNKDNNGDSSETTGTTEPDKTDQENKIVNNLIDIKGHWAETSITKLVNKGVICGNPDGTFRPDNSVTRAEFVTILIKTMIKEGLLPIDNTSNLTDADVHWAKNYLTTAVVNNIVKADAKGCVFPDRQITREEMACMLVRALNLKIEAVKSNYTDQSGISDWAVESVAALADSGVITGFADGSFRPKDNATKAQATVMIINAFNIR